jgi:hypothetical protein
MHSSPRCCAFRPDVAIAGCERMSVRPPWKLPKQEVAAMGRFSCPRLGGANLGFFDADLRGVAAICT